MKILLVGEYCTDKYIYGKVPRLSPEVPCLIFEPNETKINCGMAGNVANNIMAMFPDVELKTVFFNTGNKTRYVDINSGYQIMRLDENVKKPLQTFNTLDEEKLSEYDAIIISDYGKGFITDSLIKRIVNHPLVFVDTKRTDLGIFENAIIKINQKEADKITKTHNGVLIITMGSEGTIYDGILYPVEKVIIKDVCGAGDTFLAALSIWHTKGNSLIDSVKTANIAASIAVSKPGTSIVTKEELMDRLDKQII